MTKHEDPFTFLENPASEVAPRLLGCILERTIGHKTLRAQIVETEAYDQTDVASHSFKWKTPRTEVMFGKAGHLYVYFTYGMHYCCNIVTGRRGYGAAVLIRAVEPLEGKDIMMVNRGGQSGHLLTNGPAKFCQAFAIDKSLNGHDLHREPLRLMAQEKLSDKQVVTAKRIGISRGQDAPWRFYIRGNPYVSKP